MKTEKEICLKNIVDSLLWMAMRYTIEDNDAIYTIEKAMDKYEEMNPNFDLNSENVLKEVIEDLMPMTIRYANNRHDDYAPFLARTSVNEYKELYPDFKLKYDDSIEPWDGKGTEEDNLLDLYTNEKMEE